MKINVVRREQLIKGILPRFSSLYLEGTTEGTGRCKNLMEQCLGDVVRSGSQGIRGWLWSPLLRGLTWYLEGGTAGSATSSFLLHHGAQ